MSEPVLSIIIPAYNEEKLIGASVAQFKALTIPHEVIVSDTKSTDGTVKIAQQFTDKVVILPPEKKRGVSHGRNGGAAVAKGDFMVFMDCGTTVADPEKFFKICLDAFAKHPSLVGISGQVKVQKDKETWSDASVSWLMNAWFLFLNNLCRMGIASGKFQMVKTKSFWKTGGFNEWLSTAEDVDFFGRLAKMGRTRIIWELEVFHEGRRFHQKGAWRTLFLWMKNALSFWLFKKPSEKWDAVR